MNIRNIRLLALKELHLYFFSPVAYVILFAFSLILGYYFFIFTYDLKDAVSILPYLFNVFSILLLFSTPFMTMRLIAEEKRSGTMEILASLPFTPAELAVGKYAGAVLFYLVLLVIPFLHTLLLFVFGRPDPGVVLANWVGLLLNGAAFMSFGLLASTFSRNQIVSAMVCFLLLLFFWMFGWVGQAVGGTAGQVIAWLSLTSHFDGFNKGIMDLGDAVYFLSVISFNLTVSAKILAGRG
jgi:ABC-2 type transport system permease protein